VSFAVGAALLLSLFARAADEPPGAYKAPAPDPSPIETLMLEYINRCRANPAEDGARCALDKAVPSSVDLNMLVRELAEGKSAPPVVFDLRLLKAARWHCYYQILHGQRHDEVPGNERFTGENPSARVARAGLPGGAFENVFVGVHDPWYCHLGFVVDWGPNGAGGMQPERGHRRNILNPALRLAGVGAVPYEGDKKFSCTHNFATASARFVGGVVINDRNRNRFYDIGEGISGVALASGDQNLKSWYSGAYTLPIDCANPKITVELEGKTYAALLPDGDENLKFDIYVSDRATFNRAGSLLGALKKIPSGDANDPRRLIAQIDLLQASRGALVDAALFDEIHTLVAPVRQQLDQAMDEVRKALADGAIEDAGKAARAALQKYSRTKARGWFADAMSCLDVKESYLRMSELKAGGRPIGTVLLTRTLKRQQSLFGQMTTPEWKQAARDWAEKTAALDAK
jgi:hypothetical protein